MTYRAIDKCDGCSQPLKKGQWLSGLCEVCEAKAKAPKKPTETVTPKKGLL